MACSSCNKHALLCFFNDFAGLTLQRQPVRQVNGRLLHRRNINTTTTRLHQPSSSRLNGSLASAESAGPDDSFIPFDSGSELPCSPESAISSIPPPYATPAPPDTLLGAQPHAFLASSDHLIARFEPEIEFEGDLKGLDVAEVQRKGLAATSPAPDSAFPSTQTASNPTRERKTRTVGKAKTPIFTSSRVKPRQPSSRHALRSLAHAQRQSGTPDIVAETRKRKQTASPREGKPREAPSAGTAPPAPTAPKEQVAGWPPFQRAEQWQTYKDVLKEKFGDEKWEPRKKLSPDALEGIRALHAQYPQQFTTPVLADQFKVSPEAIRRILKSKWRPDQDEEEDRRQRWDRRGEKIWTELVEQGVHPPKRWREMGIGGGPRRPAQDRSLGKQEGEDKAVSGSKRPISQSRDGKAWLRSFAERVT